MKDALVQLRSFPPVLLALPVLMLAAVVVFLSGSAMQTEHANSAASGFTTIDAPGAGTTAEQLRGTSVFSVNADGDVAGFETDSNGVHHGFVRASSGTITVFDAAGEGHPPPWMAMYGWRICSRSWTKFFPSMCM